MYGIAKGFTFCFLINLVGFPAQISLSGTSFVTTLPAPTMEFLPILTALQITVFAPIKQLSQSSTMPDLYRIPEYLVT